MRKIALLPSLTKANLKRLVRQGIHVIIAQEFTVNRSDVPNQIALIDAIGGDRSAISWRVFKKGEEALHLLLQRFPALNKYKAYNLQTALLKQMYWANYSRGVPVYAALDQYLSEHKGPYRLLDLLKKNWTYHFANWLLLSLSYFKHWIRSFSDNPHWLPNFDSVKQSRFVFIVSSPFLGYFWGGFIRALAPEQLTILVYMSPEEWVELENQGYISAWESAGIQVVFVDKTHSPKQLSVDFLWPSVPVSLAWLLRLVLDFKLSQHTFLDLFELVLKKIKPDVVVMNAAENLYYGHLMCQLRKELNFKVVNTMNGNKTDQANNALAEFDKWFVWDEALGKLLVKDCYIPENQILNVGGHLIQDVIRMHRDSGSLAKWDSILDHRKLILFCSAFGKPLNKLNALDTIYTLLEENTDWAMIYRPHPREMESDFILPQKNKTKERVILVPAKEDVQRIELYDQIKRADLVIAVGASTTLLEASWANTPAISFEENEKPLMYSTDEERIFFANTVTRLKEKIDFILTENYQIPEFPEKDISVAEIYANAVTIIAKENEGYTMKKSSKV